MIQDGNEGGICPFNIWNTFTAGGRLVHNTKNLLLLYLFYQLICPTFLLQFSTDSWIRKGPAGLFYPRGMPGSHIISLQAPFDYNCFVISCKTSPLVCIVHHIKLYWNSPNGLLWGLVGFVQLAYGSFVWKLASWIGTLGDWCKGAPRSLSYQGVEGTNTHWMVLGWDTFGQCLISFLHGLNLQLLPARWCVRIISELLERDKHLNCSEATSFLQNTSKQGFHKSLL